MRDVVPASWSGASLWRLTIAWRGPAIAGLVRAGTATTRSKQNVCRGVPPVLCTSVQGDDNLMILFRCFTISYLRTLMYGGNCCWPGPISAPRATSIMAYCRMYRDAYTRRVVTLRAKYVTLNTGVALPLYRLRKVSSRCPPIEAAGCR